ncbi:O-antigen ligase family protein [Microbacterium sp. YY-01]|uniref:O-antigen ligase family protein n=1 Tax=Microbacterium sp. YY-01 TaxID=3421634 RepID=UPI003D181BD6
MIEKLQTQECQTPIHKSGAGITSRVFYIVLIAVTFSYTSLPGIIVLIRNGRTVDIRNSTGTIEIVGAAATLRTLLGYLVLAFCLTVVLIRLPAIFRRNIDLRILVLIIPLALILLDIAATGRPNLSAITVISVGLAIWSLNISQDFLRYIGAAAALIVFICLMMAVSTDRAWQTEEEKGILFDDVLAGPFSQMNVLGIALSVTLPYVSLLKSLTLRLFFVPGGIIVLLLSSSRTSIIAFAAAAVIMLVCASGLPAALKKLTFWLLIVIGVTVVVALPLTTTDREAFTRRGNIWINALEYAEGSKLLGRGLRVFGINGELYAHTHSAAAHGHNMLVHYFLTSGLLGVLVIGVMLYLVARNAGTLISTVPAMSASVVVLVFLGMTEVPLRLETFDGPAWATWVVLFSIAFIRRDDAPSVEFTDAEGRGARE